ncbi:MAG: hypothetical protein R3242_02135 [Akkermansiaceae bacterium]|nr:hypothetical protein [Akkermansiaceae bacterium]
MSKKPQEPETLLDEDPVWDLVDKSPTKEASANFRNKTVQLVRQQRKSRGSWWQQLLKPAPLSGLAVAAAAVVLLIAISDRGDQNGGVAGFDAKQTETIQEIVETEMLIAAADNPEQFSDQELVCLLGF